MWRFSVWMAVQLNWILFAWIIFRMKEALCYLTHLFGHLIWLESDHVLREKKKSSCSAVRWFCMLWQTLKYVFVLMNWSDPHLRHTFLPSRQETNYSHTSIKHARNFSSCSPGLVQVLILLSCSQVRSTLAWAFDISFIVRLWSIKSVTV